MNLAPSLLSFVKQILCRHRWIDEGCNRYAVIRGNGSKEGEVTLTMLHCPKCGKTQLLPTNRTHCA